MREKVISERTATRQVIRPNYYYARALTKANENMYRLNCVSIMNNKLKEI